MAEPDTDKALKQKLETVGRQPDKDIDLGETALLFSGLAHPGLSLDRYRNHLKTLQTEVARRHKELLAAGAEDNAETRLAALKHIIADKHGYHGDTLTYNDIENADLARVIERRQGMPIALCILYIVTARGIGWEGHGLNVPAHFLARIDHDGQRLIFDPFNGCKIMQAADIRQLVKQAFGPNAEMAANYYEPAGVRDILVRLQNNIKTRQIEMEDYAAAAETVEAMRLVDPDEYRLLLDAGVLYARTERPHDAIEALERYISLAPSDRDRREAALLLQQLRLSLN